MASAPPDNTKYDYIVVGSGAGGAPLAARLALHGWRVLVLEAGSDLESSHSAAHEASLVPAYHGVASEEPEMNWAFSVKHDGAPHSQDFYYPRASALGGCTIHNAMITIAGPDSDWDALAHFVEDDTWRSDCMRAYFQRLERNEYVDPPARLPTSLRARAWGNFLWLIGYEKDYTSGRHGFRGWLRTTTTDLSIGLGDRRLLNMLKAALKQSSRAGLERTWTLARRFLKGRISQSLDPNDARTQAESPEGLLLIPLAVVGRGSVDSQSTSVAPGRRSSPREFLLNVQQLHPDRLVIMTDCFVTRVVLDEHSQDDTPPRAVGVEFLKGEKLYRVDPRQDPPGDSRAAEKGEAYAQREVILCGGAFNTPQLLMMSGIGEEQQLQRHAIRCRVPLPGVGRNLQDRYEVTVVSEMDGDFSVLADATFDPTKPDRHLAEWREKGTGLYTSNAGVLGILKRSNPNLSQPDLFIFGLPMLFTGYRQGYSQIGGRHNLFTWVILKSHTNNYDGTVELASADPLVAPTINFHYFNEVSRGSRCDDDPDLLALLAGVKFVRGIPQCRRTWFGRKPGTKDWVKEEFFPGSTLAPASDDAQIKKWIHDEAWGHHACGTCRMGPARDPGAVLDSRFRVRGVTGLRVVDASIFPKIPGYYIVANIYMASEKAADVIHEDAQHGQADCEVYPRELRMLEAEAVDTRRAVVFANPTSASNCDETWSDDVAALGFSGGGIRSATFNLGILQALAGSEWLQRIDFMSTVSGGGYIGSFLGRCFDRLRQKPQPYGAYLSLSPPHLVTRQLTDPASREINWLRKHGNYIAPMGEGNARVTAATFIRNLLSVHFVIGALLFGAFGLVNAIRYGLLDPATGGLGLVPISQSGLPLHNLFQTFLGPFFSPWFFLFELILFFVVLPRIVAYWIVSQDQHERYQEPALTLLFVVVGALLILTARTLSPEPFVIAFSLCTSVFWVESAWRRGRQREQAIGRGSVETQRLRTRNLLTYDLGFALVLAGVALAFAAIDAIGHALQQAVVEGNHTYSAAFMAFLAAIAGLAPLARGLANLFARDAKSGPVSTVARIIKEQALAVLIAVVFLTVPLVFYSFSSHAAYEGGSNLIGGLSATVLAVIVTLIVAHPTALTFVNRSSIAQTYAAQLARAYLGASNPQRHGPEGGDVTEVMAGDDVPAIRDYRPHEAGGPLHLINTTVNQTVEFTSQRGNRDRKGENLAVSSIGLSVGKRWHCAWAQPAASRPGSPRRKPTPIIPLGYRAGTSHPLVDEAGEPTKMAEMLSLRQWIGISGAAVGPGRGQTTRLGTALLFGLSNLRTGYWWDGGIREAARDGFPNLTLVRRMLYLVPRIFLTQSLLLYEWVARYPGPWERYWYVSDGGFFENLAGYELIRRRIPRIILCDGSDDHNYQFEGVAELIRKARIDFNAWIEPYSDHDLDLLATGGILTSAQRDHLGTLEQLKPTLDADGRLIAPSKKHGALFRVRYSTGNPRTSILLYLKASVTGDEGVDIASYQALHQAFPHESTLDQFFDEAQWESYRQLGQHVASPLVANSTWLWNISL